MTSTIEHALRAQDRASAAAHRGQKAGGIAALYLALALLGAMPYFLLVVDYPSAITATDELALVVANYASMYAVYIVTYVLFGIGVAVLALALHDRLEAGAPFTMRPATTVGLMWSFALVTSGMVFTYGMTTVIDLHGTDAVRTWQAVEPVALALGGAGGEILGGLWIGLLSLVALRTSALPKVVGWLGVVIAVVGLTSVVPLLHDAAIAFGLLQIAWFLGVGLILVTQAMDRRARR